MVPTKGGRHHFFLPTYFHIQGGEGCTSLLMLVTSSTSFRERTYRLPTFTWKSASLPGFRILSEGRRRYNCTFLAWETLHGSFGCTEWTQLCFYLYSVDPNFYSKNLLMLGKTYMAMKDRLKSLLWLSKAKDYPARTEEDKEVTHSRAKQILTGLYPHVYVYFVCLQAHKEAVELLKKLGGRWAWCLLDCKDVGHMVCLWACSPLIIPGRRTHWKTFNCNILIQKTTSQQYWSVSVITHNHNHVSWC